VRNRLINTKAKEFEYYKGIQIHADTGVHEQAAELIKKYFPAGTTVLDVGAGAGAFSQRLADLGYSVTALDVDPQKWIPKDIPFLVLDIDKGIKASVANTYDSVCCLEVIEHVENPWNLLREIYSVTKPGGYLLLSTPNITSFLSRALFFLTGRFHQFNDGDLSYGHINPVSAFELEHAATQVGWQMIDIQPGGYLPVFDLVALRPFLWTAVFNALCGLGFVIGKGYKEGWCLFYVLRKPADAS
jgi:2-polyprenyl-3-methyl-5-hydroxy-6-metoxy-1,4-benzoquinol methylase